MTDREIVAAAFARAVELHATVGAARAEAIVAAAERMSGAIAAGGKILVFGNGGSAADAAHLAAELVGRFLRERQGWPAIALTADSATLTSIANDYGYHAVFARQVEALGQRGDVAVAITTSGASPNVNAALEKARALGLVTVALTGRDGGVAGTLADVHVNVADDSPPRVQEVHRTILHVLCELVERTLTRC